MGLNVHGDIGHPNITIRINQIHFAQAMGFVGPFMIALLPLGTGLALALVYWRDDAQDRDTSAGAAGAAGSSDSGGGPGVAGAEVASTTPTNEEVGIMSTIKAAMVAMNADARIWFLGLAQALFEGAMYTFVFLWTPALCEGLTDLEKSNVPYGLIFSSFMVMMMVGSSLFSMAMKQYDLEQLPYAIHGIAAGCCLLTVLVLGFSYGVFISFVLFELMCGIFFPTYGSLRAVYIPEEQRSTIMNFFRVPLNLFVIVVLVKKHAFSNEMTFGVCMAAHLTSLGLWHAFMLTNDKSKGKKGRTKDGVSYSVVDQESGDVDQEADFGDVEGDATL